MYLNHSWIAYETMNVDPFPASSLQPSALPVPSMPLRPAPAALPYGGRPSWIVYLIVDIIGFQYKQNKVN